MLLLLSALAQAAQPPLTELPRAADPGASDRILIVAPHPDDETLCCAGYIRRALTAGAAVGVVWLTAGDGFEVDALLVEHRLRLKGSGMQKLGQARVAEAFRAAQILGIPANQRWMLGYPDRGLNALLGTNLDQPYTSTYTHSTQISYAQALSPGAAFTGRNLTRDLQDVIGEFAPTRVLVAAPEDLHPDHAAAGKLTRQVLETRGKPWELWYYVIHAKHWPQPRRLHRDLELTPPPRVSRQWQRFVLSDAEQDTKLEALKAHHTQMEAMTGFLESFVRRTELFAY
ncbi:MAG: PIG-L family deacetylase [Pseudomonadota bacterium]